MTLGEFKKIRKDLSNDTVIVIRSDNSELKGALVKAYGAHVQDARIVNKRCDDMIDGETYTTPTYEWCDEYDERELLSTYRGGSF